MILSTDHSFPTAIEYVIVSIVIAPGALQQNMILTHFKMIWLHHDWDECSLRVITFYILDNILSGHGIFHSLLGIFGFVDIFVTLNCHLFEPSTFIG